MYISSCSRHFSKLGLQLYVRTVYIGMFMWGSAWCWNLVPLCLPLQFLHISDFYETLLILLLVCVVFMIASLLMLGDYCSEFPLQQGFDSYVYSLILANNKMESNGEPVLWVSNSQAWVWSLVNQFISMYYGFEVNMTVNLSGVNP